MQQSPRAGGAGEPTHIQGPGKGRDVASMVTFVFALVVLMTPTTVLASEEDPASLDVVLDSTQHWRGTNDVLMSVYGADGSSLADAAVPVLVELRGPAGSSLRAEPAIERFATYGRRLYRARVPLGELGRWQIAVSAEIDGVTHSGSASLEADCVLAPAF